MSDDEQAIELDDVEWLTDGDGTDYFLHDGRRYELGDDGYAYDAGPAGLHEGDDEAQSETAAGAGSRAAGHELDQDNAHAGSHVTESAPTDSMAAVVPPPRELDPHHDLGAAASRNGHGEPDTPMLRVRGLRSGYGALPVLHGIDMEIARGSTAVLLGLNGAGKTTTAANICGVVDAWAGTIELEGTDITGWSVSKRVRSGVVLVPEGRRVFPDLSVERNLQIGGWLQRKDGDWVADQRARVLEYFPRLRERLAQNAGTLSGGEQQMLAIARGLMARPRMLIIDEASMGLAPVIVSQVFDIIQQINRDGVTVMMIEQNVGALDVADVGIVMEQGTIVRELVGDELTDRTLVSQTLMG